MIKLKELDRNSPDEHFVEVEKLFKAMYAYMNQHGLKEKLTEGGEKIWLNSIKNTLGRLNFLVIAIKDIEIIGFAFSSLRITPEYLGSKKIGYISHVFVLSEYRKTGIAKKLNSFLEGIFNTKKVDSIELEVLTDNQGAICFWEKQHYKRNLLKMRKETDL